MEFRKSNFVVFITFFFDFLILLLLFNPYLKISIMRFLRIIINLINHNNLMFLRLTLKKLNGRSTKLTKVKVRRNWFYLSPEWTTLGFFPMNLSCRLCALLWNIKSLRFFGHPSTYMSVNAEVYKNLRDIQPFLVIPYLFSIFRLYTHVIWRTLEFWVAPLVDYLQQGHPRNVLLFSHVFSIRIWITPDVVLGSIS